MFGCLFETEETEEAAAGDGGNKKFGDSKKLHNSAPPPRGRTGLCGLQNQGATCYLNSLLQTLFFTPEFRDSLFRLKCEDLGELSSVGTNSKVRVIPLQLQKLFTQLLLLDRDSVETSDLTSSFGWTGYEGFQQHDVQELNRILFSAIESSLVGTSVGSDLIKSLYHGISVTKVICQECGNVSEREEDYLDLPLILSGCNSLEASLSASYVAMEFLEGRNQYKCGSCGKLVNALKGSKIRSLPPILTFSLLRFDYDMKRGERFKETKRYSFPTSLSMTQFCDSNTEGHDDQDYELFSVVIHSGSCYGGHYHAYICDMEGLGKWTTPEKEQVSIVQKGDDGIDNAVQCDNPVDLMVVLLSKLGGTASVNQVCQCLSKETGHSWNKRYKSRHGSLAKFFKRHCDVFKFSDGSGWVSLQTLTPRPLQKTDSSCHDNKAPSQSLSSSSQEERQFVEEKSCKVRRHWFDINDSRISCIREEDLQCQFSGKESAYMLFYRRKTLPIPLENPSFAIPAALKVEVEEMNKELTRQREEYDRLLNEISVHVHFEENYTVKNGVLELKQGLSIDPLTVKCDRRKTIKDLLQTISKEKRDLERLRDESCLTLHVARHLPAGLHLFYELSAQSDSSLVDSGIHDGTEAFLWDGKEVDGCAVYVGEDSAPVRLNITFSSPEKEELGELQKVLRKNTTMGETKLIVASLGGIPEEELLLAWMKPKGKSTQRVLFTADQDGMTLFELGLQDGASLVAETNVGIKSKEERDSSSAAQGSKKDEDVMAFVVENRCVDCSLQGQREKDGSPSWSVLSVEIMTDQTVGELKARILSLANFEHITGDVCHLRVEEDVPGLGPPLYEHETINLSALKQGDKLILKPGSPLDPGYLMIRYYVCSPHHTRLETEVAVAKAMTVGQCLQLLMEKANLEGMQWHLRKTNWLGEPANTLDNEEETLEDENIKNGDTLIIEEGRLPPKGFVRLSLWQEISDESKAANSQGILTWISSGIQGLLSARTPQQTLDIKDKMYEALSFIGDVEISLDASLYDLKLQISTLPQLADHSIPTPGFIRIQEILNGHLRRVLRGMNRTLRQLKLTSFTQLALQILQQEEDLSSSAVLLKLWRRTPGERSYDLEQEVIFDPTDGATNSSLLRFVAKLWDIPVNQLALAKYFRDKYKWLVIKDVVKIQGKRKGGKKKANLRHSPYFLQDGDIIGVKNFLYDTADIEDFGTPSDDEGMYRLKQQEEEKKQRRKGKHARRAEVPLRIHVDYFR